MIMIHTYTIMLCIVLLGTREMQHNVQVHVLVGSA
jgi:hypothetical protein